VDKKGRIKNTHPLKKKQKKNTDHANKKKTVKDQAGRNSKGPSANLLKKRKEEKKWEN